MSIWGNVAKARDAMAQADAISKSQAVIEFNMDGTVIGANQNFLDTLGYQPSEIVGKHHRMFVAPELRETVEYRAFWSDLNLGRYKAGEFKRIAKDGRDVWIQASYNPILDSAGKPVKVIKFAGDITAKKIRSLEDAGKIAAITRAQAVIEFSLDGTIITANDIFLGALGYSLSEIEGKHHSIFVAPSERDSAAYREFWAGLNRGEFRSGEFKRFGKGERDLDSRLLQSDPRRGRKALQDRQVRLRRDRAEAESS
jgi:methyl-accepting chemotaxis protein